MDKKENIKWNDKQLMKLNGIEIKENNYNQKHNKAIGQRPNIWERYDNRK